MLPSNDYPTVSETHNRQTAIRHDKQNQPLPSVSLPWCSNQTGVPRIKKLLTYICCFALFLVVAGQVSSDSRKQDLRSTEYGPSAEDLQMWRVATGILDESRYDRSKPIHIPAFAASEITRSKTYRLHKLDDRLSGKAIALELVKASILDELMDHVEAKADRPWGYYRLLPECGNVAVLLPSIISIEQTEEEWTNGAIELTARATYVLNRIVPAIVETCSNPDILRETKNEHSMGTDALNEIIQIQREVAEPVEGSILNKRYLEAVRQLMTVNLLQRARYFALWQDIQQAIDAYTQAIENSPSLSAAYRNRGALYIYIDNLPSALQDITANA